MAEDPRGATLDFFRFPDDATCSQAGHPRFGIRFPFCAGWRMPRGVTRLGIPPLPEHSPLSPAGHTHIVQGGPAEFDWAFVPFLRRSLLRLAGLACRGRGDPPLVSVGLHALSEDGPLNPASFVRLVRICPAE